MEGSIIYHQYVPGVRHHMVRTIRKFCFDQPYNKEPVYWQPKNEEIDGDRLKESNDNHNSLPEKKPSQKHWWMNSRPCRI